MAKEQLEIIRLNIARYQRQLETETDEGKRRTLGNLLAEARNEVVLLREEHALEQPGKRADDFLRDARRWRAQAAEYRTAADASASEATRSTCLNLARGYETLAERAEARMAEPGAPAHEAG